MQCEHHQGCTEESTEPPGDPASATARAPNLKKNNLLLGFTSETQGWGENSPSTYTCREEEGRKSADAAPLAGTELRC